jgi:RNA polymerase sigma factor (sigma-70 family)
MQSTLSQDDPALVRAARTDAEAFARLYDRYVQRLYHYCYHRTNNVRDAEDLTSQVFLAAMEAFPHYRQDGHFAAWLFTIARNKVVDHYRRAADLPLEEAVLPSAHSDLASEAESSQQRESLLRALRELPEDEQELIRLRYAAGLSFAEIGRALHKSEDAAKKTLYRLLGRLKGEMEAGHG